MSRVLVVDDDPNILDLVRHRLTAAGHVVATAASGPDALDFVAQRGLPEVAILDVSMPGMSGLELADELATRHPDVELPLVFLSARVGDADIAQGERRGAVYLTKPFVATSLIATVARLVPTVDAAW